LNVKTEGSELAEHQNSVKIEGGIKVEDNTATPERVESEDESGANPEWNNMEAEPEIKYESAPSKRALSEEVSQVTAKPQPKRLKLEPKIKHEEDTEIHDI
jgi:hypothetical protein